MDGQWCVGKYRARGSEDTSKSLEVSVCIKGGALSLTGTEGFKCSRLSGFSSSVTGGSCAVIVTVHKRC